MARSTARSNRSAAKDRTLPALARKIEAPARREAPPCGFLQCGQSTFGGLLPQLEVSESDTAIAIVVPFGGIDVHHVYVFATPSCILVEIRIKQTLAHSGAIQKEVQDRRVLRELWLREEIEKRGTTLRRVEQGLEISCVKARDDGDQSWSELLQYHSQKSAVGAGASQT